jgi:HEAT repeat protein
LVQMHLGAMWGVLTNSADEYQRGIAVYLLPYAIDKASVVEDLHAALTDNDPGVRTKAVHGLTALALLGRSNPASRVRVAPAWFLDLLQSLAWTDRTQAVWALEMLTRERDKAILASLRGDALSSLIEMSRWHSMPYAYPPFTLVGRVAGLNEVDIRDAWLRGGRDSTIAKARAAAK